MRKKKVKGREADPQRKALYRWEAAHDTFNVCALSLKQCDDLANSALKLAGHVKVTVTQGPSNRFSYNAPTLREIRLQGPSRRGRGGMNRATVLHEVAHQMVWDRHGASVRDHGPTFLAYYRDLLLGYGLMTADEFKLTARKRNLRWRRAP